MPSDAQLLLLDGHAVDALLVADEVVLAVREAFALHSRREGRSFPVIRESLPKGGIFGIKAGDVPSQGLLGFKAAGFWPGNRQHGAEPHQATILLLDPATGRPRCVIDGNAITTVRTGAAGALGLQRLARADSTHLTLFGTGVQARSQLRFALKAMPCLRSVRYLSASQQPHPALEAQFRDRCDIQCATDANAAVADADIVITATPGAGALFDAQAVRPGTHFNCVGADTHGKRELPSGLLHQVRLVVDDLLQAQHLGELQWEPQTPCVELGELLTPASTWTRAASETTVFDMTGLALQDLVVARLIFDKARAAGVGASVAWPW